MAHRNVPLRLRSAAKRLRSEMTEAEKRLWFHLRAHRFTSWGFRRQSPIGPYVIDFVSQAARLVIEVDGGQHATSTSDRARDQWLSERGYRVLRFWNNDVLAHTDSVLEMIASSLAEASPPSRPPSLRSGGRHPPQGGR
jgi:very-short-patch-repair endonuclease